MEITDPCEIREIKNSINEGLNILLHGKDTSGKPLSAGRWSAIRRSVSNLQAKIGEGIKFNPTYTIEDVTPKGYEPNN